MRIICDHCGDPVNGTVKKTAGNLNLHPDCLAQVSGQSTPELKAVTWRSGDSAVSMLLARNGSEPFSRRTLPDSESI
jgi:hypothetical protein